MEGLESGINLAHFNYKTPTRDSTTHELEMVLVSVEPSRLHELNEWFPKWREFLNAKVFRASVDISEATIVNGSSTDLDQVFECTRRELSGKLATEIVKQWESW